MPYTLIENAAQQIAIPEAGMTEKLLLDAGVLILGFGFAPGHELKEHSAPSDVSLHFLEGEASVPWLNAPHPLPHAALRASDISTQDATDFAAR